MIKKKTKDVKWLLLIKSLNFTYILIVAIILILLK